MHEFADAFLYTPYWDGFNAIALTAGLSSIFVLLLGNPRSVKEKILVWAGLALLAIATVFSMLFEEILPILPTLPAHRRLPYLMSFAGFLIFLATFVYGGRLFVRNVFTAFPGLLRRQSRRSARQAPTERSSRGNAALWRAMQPGLIWLGASVAIFLGSVVAYHGPEVTLAWAGWGR